MTHVVTENCIHCKYTDCVEVCPVDCFREGENFLVIDPEECIDCALCVSECPANAIKHELDLSQKEKKYIAINRDLSAKWNVIKVKKSPLVSANEYNGVENKLDLLKKN